MNILNAIELYTRKWLKWLKFFMITLPQYKTIKKTIHQLGTVGEHVSTCTHTQILWLSIILSLLLSFHWTFYFEIFKLTKLWKIVEWTSISLLLNSLNNVPHLHYLCTGTHTFLHWTISNSVHTSWHLTLKQKDTTVLHN